MVVYSTLSRSGNKALRNRKSKKAMVLTITKRLTARSHFSFVLSDSKCFNLHARIAPASVAVLLI
jgi:hypothetical protein